MKRPYYQNSILSSPYEGSTGHWELDRNSQPSVRVVAERRDVTTPMQLPEKTVLVQAILPDRNRSEIAFPRVAGYRVELPREELKARFSSESTLVLDPDVLELSETKNEPLVRQDANLSLEHLSDKRRSTLLYLLARHLLTETWRDGHGDPKYHLFGQLKRIAGEWVDNHLVCPEGTSIGHLFSEKVLKQACKRINEGIVATHSSDRPITAVLDFNNPTGSTRSVRFKTTKQTLWKTDPDLCHVNWAVCDSDREAEFCKIVEQDMMTKAYVKNDGLGFEIPYRHGSQIRWYKPEFIVQIETGYRQPRKYMLVEINGYRSEDANDKKRTVEEYWLPAVNRPRTYGEWDFVELGDIGNMESDYEAKVQKICSGMGSGSYTPAQVAAASRLIALGGSQPGIQQIPRRKSRL